MTVTGLNPDHLYNVRVIAANQQNFQAPGQLIRLRTRRKSQDDAEGEGGPKGKSEHVEDLPSIQPHVPALESHQAQQQQHVHHSRRSGRDRKQPSPISEQQARGSPLPDEQLTIESLTTQLEAVRTEIDDLEAQMQHTEEEHKASEGILVHELDQLRERKRNEDAGRHQLRTETRTLEEAKRAAEAQKTKTERALRAKKDEVRRMQQESRKWDEERLAALERADILSKEAEESKGRAEITERELNVNIVEAQAKIAEIEEEIRTIIATIKAMDTEKEQLRIGLQNTESSSQDEKLERVWHERQKNLEMRYVSVVHAFNLAQSDFNKSKDALAIWRTRRDSAPATTDGQAVKKLKHRRSRNRKARTHTLSNPEPPFPLQDPRFSETSSFHSQVFQTPALGSGYTASNSAYTASNSSIPYFNLHHGSIDDSFHDERQNGSTLMSPTADSLLPSDLFASVADLPSPKSRLFDERRKSLIENLRFVPQSPISSGSRSTSHVSSPRSSLQQMPLFPSAEDSLGADHERATGTPLNGQRARGQSATGNISGTRRFVNLFSFSRQRGKTLPLEPPLLGSLKPTESRSFPKNFSPVPSLDPIGTRRRSGSHGSWNLTPNIHFLHARKDTQNEDPDASILDRVFIAEDVRARLLDRSKPVSPRPLSMTSFDGVLPRPSSGVSAAFGWPAEPNPPRESRLSMLSTTWSDFTGHKLPAPNNISTHSFSSILPPPTNFAQPRLNPTAPTFESSIIKSSQTAPHCDSVSIHTDASQTDISFSTVDSASESISENVPPKESLFSRLSLSRKGSTGKFNISWKKEGRLFSRSKREHSTATTSDAGEDSDNPTAEPGALSPVPNSSHIDRDKTWKRDSAVGFFSRKKGPASDTGDEAEREREAPLTAVESSPIPSPWLNGGGFFGRKAKDHEKDKEKEGEREVGKITSMEVSNSSSPVGVKRESFFKRDKERGKEKEKEKERGRKEKELDEARKDMQEPCEEGESLRG